MSGSCRRCLLFVGVRTAGTVSRSEEEQAPLLLLDDEHERHQGGEGAGVLQLPSRLV